MVEYRSVSQVQEYTDCPYRYYLKRRARVWSRPAAWLSQGTAFHTAAEEFERSGGTMTLAETQEVFGEAYSASISEFTAHTPNMSLWFPSGPYRGMVDVERRYGIGMEQVERYIRYREAHPEEQIYTTSDQPGIELAWTIVLGDVEVRGLIDQVIQVGNESPFPRDLKTGKKPGSDFQLATYAAALLLRYGIEMVVADYWMAQTGKPTVKYDLSDWSVERLVDIFGEVDQGIRAENFDPKPDEKTCSFCDVFANCDFAKGKQW